MQTKRVSQENESKQIFNRHKRNPCPSYPQIGLEFGEQVSSELEARAVETRIVEHLGFVAGDSDEVGCFCVQISSLRFVPLQRHPTVRRAACPPQQQQQQKRQK